MTDLKDLKTKMAATSTSPKKEAKEVVPEVKAEPAEPAIVYQEFRSSRLAMRMVTLSGREIIFTYHRYITRSEEEIEYLKDEIANGNRYITYIGETESQIVNPMQQLKAEHFAEFKALQEASRSGMMTTDGVASV